jgi:hypothetical protein
MNSLLYVISENQEAAHVRYVVRVFEICHRISTEALRRKNVGIDCCMVYAVGRKYLGQKLFDPPAALIHALNIVI